MELNQLRDATVGTYPLPFDKGTISLCKQTPGDQAAAAEFLTQKRYAKAERGTGTMPLTGEMRGTMLAQIACMPITLYDLVCDPDARIMVLYLAAVRGGAKIAYQSFANQMPAVDRDVIEDVLTWVCNMKKEAPATDPTVSGPTTTS
jgi:hypothetical protein